MEILNLPTTNSFMKLFHPKSVEEHDFFTYVKDIPFQPEATEFSLNNSLWLAEMAMLAYAPTHDFVYRNLVKAGLTQVAYFEKKGTECFIADNDVFAVVSFRGTEVGALDDLMTDAMMTFVNCPTGGKTHWGFTRALDLVYVRVARYLDKLREKTPDIAIYMTGHSLGAALATLAATRYAHEQAVYTYGSPMVGDPEFTKHYNIPTYRVVNNNDIIPMIFPPAPNYAHVGQLEYFDSQGNLHSKPKSIIQRKEHYRGHLNHAKRVLRAWGKGDMSAVPNDNVVDHAPLFYVIQCWNANARRLAT